MNDFYSYYSLYEYKHGLRVAEISLIIASNMVAYSKSEMELLRLAGQNHDIGKSKIPREIVNKPGKLSADEDAIMRMHPILGYKDVLEITKSLKCAEIVKHHHEYWNGKGYPYGLSGQSIPSQSRIISISDGLDALTHDRPYRKAYSFDKSVEIIKSETGIKYDPKVFEAFESTLDEISDYINSEKKLKDSLEKQYLAR